MSSRIPIAIISDSPLLLQILSSRLARETDLDLVAAVSNIRDLYAVAQARPVQIVLVTSTAGSGEPTEAIRHIKSLFSAARIIAIAKYRDESSMLRSIEAGATVCIDEGTTYQALLEKLRGVHHGQTPCSTRMMSCVMERIQELASAEREEDYPPAKLSNRELQVARLLAIGLMNKQIARRLGIQQRTVKSHVQRVLKKFDIDRRTDVMWRAQLCGLFQTAAPQRTWQGGVRS